MKKLVMSIGEIILTLTMTWLPALFIISLDSDWYSGVQATLLVLNIIDLMAIGTLIDIAVKGG